MYSDSYTPQTKVTASNSQVKSAKFRSGLHLRDNRSSVPNTSNPQVIQRLSDQEYSDHGGEIKDLITKIIGDSLQIQSGGDCFNTAKAILTGKATKARADHLANASYSRQFYHHFGQAYENTYSSNQSTPNLLDSPTQITGSHLAQHGSVFKPNDYHSIVSLGPINPHARQANQYNVVIDPDHSFIEKLAKLEIPHMQSETHSIAIQAAQGLMRLSSEKGGLHKLSSSDIQSVNGWIAMVRLQARTSLENAVKGAAQAAVLKPLDDTIPSPDGGDGLQAHAIFNQYKETPLPDLTSKWIHQRLWGGMCNALTTCVRGVTNYFKPTKKSENHSV